MQFKSQKTPADAYTIASIAPGSIVDVQNKSTRDLMVFAGDSAPADLNDYFVLPGGAIQRYQGQVIAVWSELPCNVMVQEV